MKTNRFPQGWDEKRVKALLAHYERQSDAEAIAEDEAAYDDPNQVVMLVPKTLVPRVRNLVARHQAPKPKARGRSARGKHEKRAA